jgi:4,5-DOPA dioxygenase extradiol
MTATPTASAPQVIQALSARQLQAWRDVPRTEPLPVIFLGHGSPMNAIEDNPFRRSWAALGQELLARGTPPRLILCISAHWLTRGWQLTAMAEPRTIHDFGGFPQALFDQQYPAPGAPGWAEGIAAQVQQPGGTPLGLDHGDWGLDHGSWAVLKPMFPDADIPVVQLSMDYSRPPAEHLALGRQLRALRERGVLIVGSGNVVHNLRTMRRELGSDQAYDWALEFDQWTADHIQAGRLQGLADFQQQGALAQMAHPTHEHYLPLLYAAGAVGADEAPRFFNERYQAGSIAMRSVVWG